MNGQGRRAADLPSRTVSRHGSCCSGNGGGAERGEVSWDRNAQKHQTPLRDFFFVCCCLLSQRVEFAKLHAEDLDMFPALPLRTDLTETPHCPQGGCMQPAVALL